MEIGMNLAGDSDAVLELLRSSSHVEFVAQTVGRFDAVATLSGFPNGLQNTFRVSLTI